MNAAAALPAQIGRFLAARQPLPASLVVAVSGGPDSVALLRGLLVWRSRSTTPRLVVAHLNHQLRGDESLADEAFVRQLVAALQADGVPELDVRCDRLDVAAQAVGGNLENVARRLRYDWLAHIAETTGCRWVLTGHTADDQAETVLHRLLRGTGVQGLRGIAPRRSLRTSVELLRPLLGVTRAEVLAFLEDLHQPARLDSSNLDRDLTRNRLRHELLPLLARDWNPAIAPLLGQLASQAAELTDLVADLAEHLRQQAELPRAGARLIFARPPLQTAPRHLVRELLRAVWQREGWPAAAMDYAAWERLASVVYGEAKVVDLPGRIRAVGRERVLQVGPVE